MNWHTSTYRFVLEKEPSPGLAERVFDQAWRRTFSFPGFCLLEIEGTIDSHLLRSWMVKLRGFLNDIALAHNQGLFAIQSMARFDQQDTTKFHLDGAPGNRRARPW